jgi:hypothetical protein
MILSRKISDGMPCDCDKCRKLCYGIPGIFAPGEATKAAAYLNIPLREFFEKYLVIDIREYGKESTLDYSSGIEVYQYLQPARINQIPGKKADYWDVHRRAMCRLLTNNGCLLPYEIRPNECRVVYGCKPETFQDDYEVNLVKAWDGNNGEVNQCFTYIDDKDESNIV